MTKVSAEVVVAGAKSTKNVVFHSVQSTSESFVQQVVGCFLLCLLLLGNFCFCRVSNVKELKVLQED